MRGEKVAVKSDKERKNQAYMEKAYPKRIIISTTPSSFNHTELTADLWQSVCAGAC